MALPKSFLVKVGNRDFWNFLKNRNQWILTHNGVHIGSIKREKKLWVPTLNSANDRASHAPAIAMLERLESNPPRLFKPHETKDSMALPLFVLTDESDEAILKPPAPKLTEETGAVLSRPKAAPILPLYLKIYGGMLFRDIKQKARDLYSNDQTKGKKVPAGSDAVVLYMGKAAQSFDLNGYGDVQELAKLAKEHLQTWIPNSEFSRERIEDVLRKRYA